MLQGAKYRSAFRMEAGFENRRYNYNAVFRGLASVCRCDAAVTDGKVRGLVERIGRLRGTGTGNAVACLLIGIVESMYSRSWSVGHCFIC